MQQPVGLVQQEETKADAASTDTEKSSTSGAKPAVAKRTVRGANRATIREKMSNVLGLVYRCAAFISLLLILFVMFYAFAPPCALKTTVVKAVQGTFKYVVPAVQDGVSRVVT